MRMPDLTLASRAPQLDDRPLARRVGLIILATDHTTEIDFQRMVASDRIGVYATRIPYANPVTPENLRAMQPSLTAGAALILPDEPLDVVMYSCTSASVVIGDAEVEAAIRAAKPEAAVVTPTAAAVRGLNALGAKRISILTPYSIETSRPMADYFLALGFDIARFTCLGLTDDREMARITPDEIVAFAKEATAPDCDALFISCTAVRAAGVVAGIEAAIGKPVVSSNLATAWACLRLCGDAAARPELGRLMTLAFRER
ncbi:ectoine utilization protein EutA [Shinella daejeonensis]|uniref:ectoine utilization protein EutA n=1 Tax=Shinella daejeonensis TaxID=659017 RepID=UPI0020C7E349|nr:ectoine utilization protein EutA [Shinella daejeonensis]MCP8894516.1 ectoine utilization protein EutA [Shinella daejeonensis]